MSRTYLCLDIREQSISALLLKSSLKGNTVEGHLHLPVEPAEDIGNPWHAGISSVVEQLDTRGAVCLVTLPPALVSFRNLRLPFKDNRKIRQVLPFEIEPLLPFPLDEVILDFHPVRQAESTDLIAGAVQKAAIQPILDALAVFRLKPRIIIPGGFPVALCLARQRQEESFLYLDMDEATITLFAVVSGHIHMVRSVYTGQVSPEVTLRTLKTHVRRMQAAFETVYEYHFDPAMVCFSGQGPDDETIERAFADLWDLPVEPVAMQRYSELKIQAEANAAAPEHINNPLALAAVDLSGMASLDFFQQRHVVFRYWEEYKADIIKTGLLGVFVLSIAMGGLIFEVRQLSQQVKQVDKRIESIFTTTFPEVSRIVDPLQQMQVNVRQARGKNVFADIREDGVLNIDILKDLSRLIPAGTDVVITRFVKGEDSVLVSGHTDTFNAVDDIKGALSSSRIFREITISSANMDQSANRVQFRLKLEIS